MNDAGLAGYFAGLSQPLDVDSSPFCGALFETWVWSEVRKAINLIPNTQAFFYRTHAGKEVDFVLVRGSSLYGIECKWATSVTLKDFDGLKDLQDAAGNQVKGIVLYTGQEIVPFSHTLIAVPMGCFL